ncbi:hypothetical protein AgCh_030821 [Apium graveolens]
MDVMHDINSRFARDLTQALGTAFRATFVNIQWPVFGEDSMYPPPNTPNTPPVGLRILIPSSKGFTMGYGKFVSGNVVIEDEALVAGLEVNLLSVSQFTDRGFKVLFDKGECSIISKKTGEVALK